MHFTKVLNTEFKTNKGCENSIIKVTNKVAEELKASIQYKVEINEISNITVL